MTDERMKRLAKNLVEYSCRVKPGDNVLIENTDIDTAMTIELIKSVSEAGGRPFVQLNSSRVDRAIAMTATEAQLAVCEQYESLRMSNMQAYIGIRGYMNSLEMSDVPSDLQSLRTRLLWQKVHGNIRIPNTNWVVLRWPTQAFAQMAGMSTEAFEDFYFDVCCLDYSKMSRAMDSLVSLMGSTDRVRLTARDTDISFSIKGIPAVKCDGKMNIPDGEVYTAPVRDSVNGVIHYNTPSVENGFRFEDVRLTFRDGRIVDSTANDNDRVRAMFDTDEGARFVGEFALGVNPYITRPMYDILFDEKISGSIHFTPGRCYDDAPNGNSSAIHWDLVLIQTPEFGGGDIFFDDRLIRHDGRFVIPELECLNPENLK